MNSGWFDNRTKGVMKINTKSLMKTFSNKASFILRNKAIKMLFNTKHPFTIDNILRGAREHEFLHTNSKKCCNFIIHDLSPFNMFNGLGNASGFKRHKKRVGYSGLIETLGLENIIFGFVGHGMSGGF